MTNHADQLLRVDMPPMLTSLFSLSCPKFCFESIVFRPQVLISMPFVT